MFSYQKLKKIWENHIFREITGRSPLGQGGTGEPKKHDFFRLDCFSTGRLGSAILKHRFLESRENFEVSR